MSVSVYEILNKALISAARRNIPFGHYRLFYFGSRVSGRATARSDFDIGVEAENKIPFHVIENIKEELEGLPILQKIDLVDFSRVTEGFSIEAKKNMEIIYEQ